MAACRLRKPGLAGLALLALSAGPSIGAHAQDSGSGARDSGSMGAAASYLSDDDAARFAKQIEADLAARGARVALVFRSGRPRDKLPEGISYTHGAFWVYQPIRLGDGRTVNGYAVYNLYHGPKDGLSGDERAISNLVQDFPFDFARGSGIDDVGILIPTPVLQQRILATMASPTYDALHVTAYSLVANPHDAQFQNCNEFMLDVIASAAWNTSDYRQIKANLKAHFVPSVVKTNLVQRMIGPATDPRLRLGDHKGPIMTATFDSLKTFLDKQSWLAGGYVLQRDPAFVLPQAR